MRTQTADPRPCPQCGQTDKVQCRLFSITPLEPEDPERQVGPLSEGDIECHCSRCDHTWHAQPIGRDL